MKKIILFLLVIFALLPLSCARFYNSEEVQLSDVNTVLSYEDGIVEYIKPVVISDDGSGTFIGAATGTVLGSLIGRGKASALSALIGGLTGAYVGNQLGKANALELYIKLDSGKKVVAIVKGLNFNKGDRVRLILDGGRIVRVEKLS
jgi:outer membrane lipoprotein SlyB